MKYYFFSFTYRYSNDDFDVPLSGGSMVIKASNLDLAVSGFWKEVLTKDRRSTTIIFVFSESV